MQSGKFDFVINLKTDKTFGLDVPLHRQQLANDVIEWGGSLPEMAVCHEYRRSIRRYATVREMKEDPSRSAIRC